MRVLLLPRLWGKRRE
uniref:Uncharacterized protein n=1 Tax=Arundo donax TaxID=35708 RepID=A0A0A9AU32_ARUDO